MTSFLGRGDARDVLRSLFASADVPPARRFLSEDECRALGDRIDGMAAGGGQTILNITSRWSGSARWARNAVHTTTDVEESTVRLTRMIRGSNASSTVNEFSDRTLRGAMARAEEETKWAAEEADQSPAFPEPPQAIHPYLKPVIWFEPTYNLAPDARIAAIVPLIEAARAAGFMIAGNLEVGGEGTSYVRNAPNPVLRYYPHTTVQVSMTVRDARNGGSGWAGLDHNDWSRIDVAALGRIAMHKCEASRHPVAVEPGRYTAILEPQAVGDLVMSIIGSLDRQMAESGMGPFADPDRPGYSKIGKKVLDERITIGIDPMDPECGFVPFDDNGEPYRAINWIENGILRELSYSRGYAIINLRSDFALPNPGACRMSGGTTTVDEMIASTERGVLVTRFSGLLVLNGSTLVTHGETRDGLWFIEKGKISKPIKNFRIAESPLFALNNLEQMGKPQRVFHPTAPVVVPPVKVRDFNFPGLMDAV